MAELKEVKIEKILFSKTNPRKEFNKNSLQELAESIESNGLINPVTLRKKGSNYELVSGERRVRACKLIKKKSVVAIVKDLTDEQVLEIQYIENLQRQDVHPLDEATFISGMLETGKYSIETIADKIGKTKAYITGRLQLTKLVPAVRKAYADGKIELGHALLIAKLQNTDQEKLYKENLSDQSFDYTIVEDLKKIIKNLMLNLMQAPFNTKDKLLLPDAGNCSDCPKRTGNALDLFAEFSGKNICTDPGCYEEKVRLHILKRIDRATAEGVRMVGLVDSYNGDKANGIYGYGGYKRVEKNDPKKLKEIAVKGIYTSGRNRGKVIDVVFNDDLKALEKKETPAAAVVKKQNIKDLVEEENNKIKSLREKELRTKLGFEIECKDLSKAILMPVIKEIIIIISIGGYFDTDDYLAPIQVEINRKSKDEEIIDAFNRSAVAMMKEEDSSYEFYVIDEVCNLLGVDHKAIKEELFKQYPLVTADEMKKRIKSGEDKKDAESDC